MPVLDGETITSLAVYLEPVSYIGYVAVFLADIYTDVQDIELNYVLDPSEWAAGDAKTCTREDQGKKGWQFACNSLVSALVI